MISACLMWSLESYGLLSKKQCGFRSRLAHPVPFETFIRNALVKKRRKNNNNNTLTIFFDLEKAYDTAWKQGILADLWDLGFRGPSPQVYSELPVRTFFQGQSWLHSVGAVRAGDRVPQGQ